MGYSSAGEARQAREALGKALEALQKDAEIPKEALGVAQNIAKSVGALFEAEYASTELDGKTCVKSALGTLSQTLALLQDVKSEHPAVETATESIADVISILFPLTNKPSVRPDSPSSAAPPKSSAPPSAPPKSSSAPPSVSPESKPPTSSRPPASERPLSAAAASSRPSSVRPASTPVNIPPVSKPPSIRPPSSRPPSNRPISSRPVSNRPMSAWPRSGAPAPVPTSMLPPPPPVPTGERYRIEANLGATTQSNFYVGFSGEIAHGGVFLATYETLPKDTSVTMLVTLPGGFEFECDGYVRFVRDPLDFASESEPGIGIQFEGLSNEARDLVLRFIRKRPPMFYDV
jgi:uncharacterized protein (TIGR02266 family)